MSLTLHLDGNDWLAGLVNNFEWKQLAVCLDKGMLKTTTTQLLRIESSMRKILDCLTDETLVICESHVKMNDSVALLIRFQHKSMWFPNRYQ